jgi:hypothetical protein
MSTNPHHITLAEAAEMTKNYRDANPGATLAGRFSKQAVEELFLDPLSVGMRVYNGINAAGEQSLVLVGVDAAGNDLYNGPLEDRMSQFPPETVAPNPLNS